MITTTFTLNSIAPALGQLDRAIHDTANAAQGLAILAIAGTDTALNLWQDWSDRTFGTIQPHILTAIESACYVIGWIAAVAWLACTRTWAAWLDTAPQRALMADVMGENWDTARRVFAVMVSALAVAVVAIGLTGGYVLSNAPRWAGRVIAIALCVW